MLLSEGIKSGTVKKTNQVTKLTVDGLTETYPIYQVRLNELFFNDQNDRIASWISQYKENKKLDKLNKDDINKYNDIIQEFITKSNPERLKQTQKNIELVGQQKYGVVLNDGRIIDGNRRFSCLRNLSKNSDKFNYFETVILERNYEDSAKQIKMLELQIQIGEETKVDYDPIDKLVGIYHDITLDHLLTVEEYARSTNQKVKDIEKQIEISNLLVEFLDSIKASDKFYIAREMDLNGPLVELYGILKKVSDEVKKQELKMIVFANFLKQPSTDMTRFIREVKGIASSNFIDEFIDKESDLVESVLDDIPNDGSVNSEYISNVRKDDDVKEELARIMDIIGTKAKATDTKNRPQKMLKKAADSIASVDLDVLNKLSDEQLEEINSSLIQIDELISGIKEKINV